MIMISKNAIGIYEGGGGRIAAGGGLFAGGPFAAGLIAGGLFASGLNAALHIRRPIRNHTTMESNQNILHIVVSTGNYLGLSTVLM